MKIIRSEQGLGQLVIIVSGLILVIGLILYSFNSARDINARASTASASSKAPETSSPGVIQFEYFAANVDENGKQIKSTNIFPDTVKKVYVVLGLRGAKMSQKLEYTRYLNNKFVDKGEILVPVDNAKYASIVFDLNSGKVRTKGVYLVKTYTDGAFERSASYTIQ
jgi:hypothetical protein